MYIWIHEYTLQMHHKTLEAPISFFLSFFRKVNFPNFLFLITFLLQRHNHTLFPNFRSYLLKSCYRRRNKDLYSQIFLLTKLLRMHLYPSARCYAKIAGKLTNTQRRKNAWYHMHLVDLWPWTKCIYKEQATVHLTKRSPPPNFPLIDNQR